MPILDTGPINPVLVTSDAIGSRLPSRIYRGTQPQSVEDFNKLERLNIKHVLSLENGSLLLLDGDLKREEKQSTSRNIAWYNIPMGEIFPPSQSELARATNIIYFKRNEGIYVHCRTGVDRTGMVIARWRMRGDFWMKDKAKQEMYDMGMHIHYYWWHYAL